MPKDFFSAAEQKQIIEAIKEAEKNTSGEIRLHIDKTCAGDVLDGAAFWFEKLKMHKSELRNGVLFYLAVKNKKFAILGDAGINQKVPEGFWDEIKSSIIDSFRQGKYAEGLINGILESGKQLKTHFPYQQNDTNELSDEISFGKK
jgi:uncharacterized membrane protein